MWASGGAGQGRPTLGASAAARSEGVPLGTPSPILAPSPLTLIPSPAPRLPHTLPSRLSCFPGLGMKMLPREGCACAPRPRRPGAALRVQGSLGRGSGPATPRRSRTCRGWARGDLAARCGRCPWPGPVPASTGAGSVLPEGQARLLLSGRDLTRLAFQPHPGVGAGFLWGRVSGRLTDGAGRGVH